MIGWGRQAAHGQTSTPPRHFVPFNSFLLLLTFSFPPSPRSPLFASFFLYATVIQSDRLYTYKLHCSFHMLYSSPITQWVLHELSHERGMGVLIVLWPGTGHHSRWTENFMKCCCSKSSGKMKCFIYDFLILAWACLIYQERTMRIFISVPLGKIPCCLQFIVECYGGTQM